MSSPLDDEHMHAAKDFRENSGDIMEDYKGWKQSIKENSVFDDKTRELLGLAVAASTQCQYCVHIHGQKALKYGATEEEISQVVQIASQVQAGAVISHGLEALEHSED